MAAPVYVLSFLSPPHPLNSYRGLLCILTIFALATSFSIFSSISSTPRLAPPDDDHRFILESAGTEAQKNSTPILPTSQIIQNTLPKPTQSSALEHRNPNQSHEDVEALPMATHSKLKRQGSTSPTGTEAHKNSTPILPTSQIIQISLPKPTQSSALEHRNPNQSHEDVEALPMATHSKLKRQGSTSPTENYTDHRNEVFHDEQIFLENYKEMNRTMKVFVYPHSPKDPFANVLLPVSFEPEGNYASEGYFKKALLKSHFVTRRPSEADLFFLPFSIASMRHDRRIGVKGIPNFVRDYVHNISHRYPHWNRTGGADHFYVACHSIGKVAMEKAVQVRNNAIQVVCTSNYFVAGYVAHKDVSLPQIWPRHGHPPLVEPLKRKKLAFFAGANNSPVRTRLVEVWKEDRDIFAHSGRLKSPYPAELLDSKFCLHAKGYEVNTARIGDALFYGCVPVILADHYDLPFDDILNWDRFSVVVATADIPNLKKILKEIRPDEYVRLQRNVLKVRRHFQWHTNPIDYDAFYMVMYGLWMRRASLRISNL